MKTTANTISIPARVSLWLGVILLIVAYQQKEVALLVIGGIFVFIGCGLWMVYGNLSSLYDRCEYAVYRLLRKTPIKHLQWFYNLEVGVEKKRMKYQKILKNEIGKAEKFLQTQNNNKKTRPSQP